MYFGGGLGMTGAAVALLRNSRFAYTNPWILLFGSLGLLFGTMMTPYDRSPALKHLLYGGFIGTMALSMVPLINMAGLPIIFDAMLATGVSMGALGLVAYNAPSE
jgi:FtsH-binding integral membrane protein